MTQHSTVQIKYHRISKALLNCHLVHLVVSLDIYCISKTNQMKCFVIMEILSIFDWQMTVLCLLDCIKWSFSYRNGRRIPEPAVCAAFVWF